MQTILGANGIIGYHTAKALTSYTKDLRLVSRNPKKINGHEQLVKANLTNPTEAMEAIKGSKVAYLVVGLPYDTHVWRRDWPLIMTNVINACKEHQTKLVFFDNVYAYGRCHNWMTEDTPFNPSSMKGEIRAKIATQLLEEIKSGNLVAQIARAADFYGPNTPLSFVSMMVFENLAKGKSAQWMINDQFKHSLTYTPDAGYACAVLGNTETAYGQTWHVPTHADVLSGKQFIELVATAMATAPNYQVLKKWMLQMVGMFNPVVKESIEMLYQMEQDYLFSSKKFETAFNFEPTNYKRGVVDTVATYL